MRFKASLATMACAVSALGLAACSSSSGGSSASGSGSGNTTVAQPCVSPGTPGKAGGSSGGSSTTLTMEQSPVASIVDNLNPFNQTSSASNTLGATQMIYEPLLQFNELKPGSYYPWLAKSFKWSNSGKTITFTLASGIKFTDGEAFDANNAAWEFNWLKKNASVNIQALPIANATAKNATTLVVNFTEPQYTDLYNIANVSMVPEKVWSAVKGDPSKFADTNPVGTGPYTLKTFSTQGLTLTRNTKYWQGESQVPNLSYPAYSSNTTANQALENGSLQWAGNYVQNIKPQFLAKSPNNHCWDFGLQTETLVPNLTQAPFTGSSGLAVRQAISYGLNRQEISGIGEGGQQPPVQGPGSLTGITLPLDQQYVTPDTAKYVATYDVAKAKSTLTAAGFKMGSDGYFQKNGQDLAFTVEDPSEYTDFIADDNIMQQQLKAVGIKVNVKGTTVDGWNADYADGNFNAIAHWGNGGISPYNMYDNWLDNKLAANPKAMTGDNEQFTGPDADKAQQLLQQYAATPTTDTADQIKAVAGLEKIVATDLPVIPLFYGVAWFEYNDSNWTGWPSPSNMYAPGQPNGPMNEITVLHLKPAK